MSVWIPGLIVVALGLVAGLWFARRPREEGDAAPGADATIPAKTPPAAPQLRSAPAPGSRRSAVIGFLVGVATSLAIVGLVYWATQGSRPKSDEMPPRAGSAAAAPGSSPGDAATAHDESADLSPEAAAELARLRSAVQSAPQDLNARRQLTVALLTTNQLMEAFEQARELQRLSPGDPDGLFVEGVVRLTMGQWQVAIGMMDQVLAQHPDHVLAALAKGQAEAAIGRTPDAIATWKKGLAAAGGKFPPIEELLAQAESGALLGGANGGETAGTTGDSSGTPGAPGTPEIAPTAVPDAGGAIYRVRVELAPGAAAPRGATLFLALRGDQPGPPAAVKRIPDPTFPLELTLSADDSMMGQPLPTKGKLTIHLDGDGNASTESAGDLLASIEVFSGTPVNVELGATAR